MTELDSGPPKKWRITGMQIALSLGSLALAVLLLGLLLPEATGAGWGEALAAFGKLDLADIAVMTALWALGLWLYTYVYTGSMPGIRHSQALCLNLTGSLVSNLLPFGGAAGIANTYGLTYAWGFSGIATSLMILVSGLANILIRIVLPLVGLLALLASDIQLPESAGGVLLGTLSGLIVIAIALVAMLVSPRIASAIGWLGDRLIKTIYLLVRRPLPAWSLREYAVTMQLRSKGLLARGWPAITFGMVAYYASETVLFGYALNALGAPLPWPELVAVFALSRVLTSVVVTPSGVGISEAGTAGVLVLFGTPPAIAAAAVLILHFYTYLIEIPAGIAGWGWIAVMRRRWTPSSRDESAA